MVLTTRFYAFCLISHQRGRRLIPKYNMLEECINRYRSNVEIHSTLRPAEPGPTSSSNRHVIVQFSLSSCRLVAAIFKT